MPRLGTGKNQERINGTELGKRIRAIRLEKNITVQKLADATGVQTGFINQLEAGDRVPSFTTLIHLINALEVSADELLYAYITHPAPGTIDRRISRLLQGADEQQLCHIEAHILLDLQLMKDKEV